MSDKIITDFDNVRFGNKNWGTIEFLNYFCPEMGIDLPDFATPDGEEDYDFAAADEFCDAIEKQFEGKEFEVIPCNRNTRWRGTVDEDFYIRLYEAPTEMEAAIEEADPDDPATMRRLFEAVANDYYDSHKDPNYYFRPYSWADCLDDEDILESVEICMAIAEEVAGAYILRTKHGEDCAAVEALIEKYGITFK